MRCTEPLGLLGLALAAHFPEGWALRFGILGGVCCSFFALTAARNALPQGLSVVGDLIDRSRERGRPLLEEPPAMVPCAAAQKANPAHLGAGVGP